jgi:hypothetical protein
VPVLHRAQEHLPLPEHPLVQRVKPVPQVQPEAGPRAVQMAAQVQAVAQVLQALHPQMQPAVERMRQAELTVARLEEARAEQVPKVQALKVPAEQVMYPSPRRFPSPVSR